MEDIKITAENKEESMFVLSQILKDIMNGEYIPIPKCLPVEETEKTYFRDMAIHSIRIAMEVLSHKLNLEEGLKNTLMMSRLDSV